jgi:hypothetical protein
LTSYIEEAHEEMTKEYMKQFEGIEDFRECDRILSEAHNSYHKIVKVFNSLHSSRETDYIEMAICVALDEHFKPKGYFKDSHGDCELYVNDDGYSDEDNDDENDHKDDDDGDKTVNDLVDP